MKNVDEPGRSPYQHDAVFSSQFTTTWCSLDFPSVPAGKRLVVEFLSVEAQIPVATNRGIGMSFYREIANPLNGHVMTYFNFSSAGSDLWISNPKVTGYINGGFTPRLQVAVDAGKTCRLEATLAGHLIDLNQ